MDFAEVVGIRIAVVLAAVLVAALLLLEVAVVLAQAVLAVTTNSNLVIYYPRRIGAICLGFMKLAQAHVVVVTLTRM